MVVSLKRSSTSIEQSDGIARLVEHINFMLQELEFGQCKVSLFVNDKQTLLQSLNRVRAEHGLPRLRLLKQAILAFERLLILKKGMQHSRIVSLKSALHAMGYFEKPFSEQYDDKTELAVMHYQEINQLKVTGIADLETIKHLREHVRNYISQINLDDVATITQGKWLQRPSSLWPDSPHRIHHGKVLSNIQKGDLILAKHEWMGEDIVDYLDRLDTKGCIGVVMDTEPDRTINKTLPILKVRSTVKALVRLASQARENISGTVIAVTGSAGKTSAKEMLSYLLSKQANTVSTRGSANSIRAISYKLLNAPLHSQFYIFESGLGAGGSSIAQHSKILAPHVALITSVHLAHSVGYKNVDEIARRKADIFTSLNPEGYALIDHDSASYSLLRQEALQKGVRNIYSFGWHSAADAKLIAVDVDRAGTSVTALLDGNVIKFKVPMIGKHWGKMGLAVLACCSLVGADIKRAIADLRHFPQVAGRGELLNLDVAHKKIKVFDSHYNANPGSMQTDLDAFAELMAYKDSRKIGILGAMKELGEFAEVSHRGIAPWVLKVKFSSLILIGTEMRFLAEELESALPILYFNSVSECFSALTAQIQDGDYIFVKGSRDNELEKIISYLRRF